MLDQDNPSTQPTWQGQTAEGGAPVPQPASPQPYDQYAQYPNSPYTPQPQMQYPQQQAAGPYAQPNMPPVAPQPPSNGKATGALVCGILAIVFSSTIIVGIVLGIIAIVLGLKSKKQAGGGKSIAGIVTGAIGLVLSVLLAIFAVVGLYALGEAAQNGDLDEIIAQLEDETDQTGGNDTGTSGTDDSTGLDGTGTSGTDDSTNDGGTAGGSDATDNEPAADGVVKLNGTIMDNDLVTMDATSMEIYLDGELSVDFTVTNKTGSVIEIYNIDSPWQVNGTEVEECVFFTTVEPGETMDDIFFIAGTSLPESAADVDSITGSVLIEVSGEEPISVPFEMQLS